MLMFSSSKLLDEEWFYLFNTLHFSVVAHDYTLMKSGEQLGVVPADATALGPLTFY